MSEGPDPYDTHPVYGIPKEMISCPGCGRVYRDKVCLSCEECRKCCQRAGSCKTPDHADASFVNTFISEHERMPRHDELPESGKNQTAPFQSGDLVRRCVYEVMMGKKKAPLLMMEQFPHGVLFDNLDTGREVFIKDEKIPKRVLAKIENLSEWRLKKGERK